MSDQGKRYKKIKTRTFDNLKGFHQQQKLCTSTLPAKIMQMCIYISFDRFLAKGFSILANLIC